MRTGREVRRRNGGEYQDPGRLGSPGRWQACHRARWLTGGAGESRDLSGVEAPRGFREEDFGTLSELWTGSGGDPEWGCGK